ncbi:hypothetical protein, partial [Klebsiella pneumoniae]|uniref:hypothetical protein n=1 Tax=Klebsiella pneumoniae TaxID=573 RepID=UPI003EE3492C
LARISVPPRHVNHKSSDHCPPKRPKHGELMVNSVELNALFRPFADMSTIGEQLYSASANR